MKFLTLICLVFFSFSLLATDLDNKCSFFLNAQKLFSFKKSNNNKWQKSGKVSETKFNLSPSKVEQHEISWRPLNKNNAIGLTGGSIKCEIPVAWEITLHNPLEIVYPNIMHGFKQSLALREITTFAGIFFSKSELPLIDPDRIRVIWHLDQNPIAKDIVKKIKSDYNFLDHNLAIKIDSFNKTDGTQLVALNFSNRYDINDDNQLWLITDASSIAAIKRGSNSTSHSKHNKWLPWFHRESPEFSSKEPIDAYELTLLAPTDQADIYDRSTGNYLPEVPIKDNAQRTHDVIAESTDKFINGSASSLYVHMLLKKDDAYRFITFESKKDGSFDEIAYQSIYDPTEIGLPSSLALGFNISEDYL